MGVARRLAEATPQGLQAQARKNSPIIHASQRITSGASHDVLGGTCTSTGVATQSQPLPCMTFDHQYDDETPSGMLTGVMPAHVPMLVN